MQYLHKIFEILSKDENLRVTRGMIFKVNMIQQFCKKPAVVGLMSQIVMGISFGYLHVVVFLFVIFGTGVLITYQEEASKVFIPLLLLNEPMWQHSFQLILIRVMNLYEKAENTLKQTRIFIFNSSGNVCLSQLII